MALVASLVWDRPQLGPAAVAEEPAYLRNLKALGKADPTIQVLEDLERELYANPSDRAVAVMFGSFVEASLRRLVISRMRDELNSKMSFWRPGGYQQLFFAHDGRLRF